jgi:MFS family permease
MSADPAPRTATAWPQVFLLFLAGVAAAFQIGKIPGSLPFLKIDLGLTLFLAGWVVSIFNLLAATGGIVVGAAADRIGHRRVTLFGMVLSASAGAVGAFAESPSLLLATRVFEGLGFLLTVVSMPPLLLSICAPADRQKAMGLWGAYMPAGMGGMLLASGPLLAVIDWRSLWLITSVLILAIAAAIAWTVPRPRRSDAVAVARITPRDIVRTARTPGPLLMAAVFTTYAAQWLAVMSFLPLMLVEQGGFAPSSAALFGAGAAIINVVGNVSSGFLLDRGLKRASLIAIASIVMGAGALGVFLDILPFWLRYLCVLAFSVTGGIIPGALFAGVTVHAPRPGLVSSVTGLMQQGAAFGQLVGPPMVGWLVTTLGTWTAAPLFTLSAAAATCVSGLALGRLERRNAGQPNAPSRSSAAHSSSK